jgi:hypothetical protein
MKTATQPNENWPQRVRQRAASMALGYRINELPIGRTHAYKLINEGKLQAKKSGNVTIVTNWPEYVHSLPAVGEVA